MTRSICTPIIVLLGMVFFCCKQPADALTGQWEIINHTPERELMEISRTSNGMEGKQPHNGRTIWSEIKLIKDNEYQLYRFEKSKSGRVGEALEYSATIKELYFLRLSENKSRIYLLKRNSPDADTLETWTRSSGN